MNAPQEISVAAGNERSSARPVRPGRQESRLRKHASAMGMVAKAALARLIGRRSGHGLAVPVSAEAFQHDVLEASRPVLVMFYKTGCPTCVLLEPVLELLAREYGGRVMIAKYKHLNPFFRLTSSRIMKRYRVYLVPTVILFVNGQERRRWFVKYCADDYRRVLDRALKAGDAGLPDGGDESSADAAPVDEAMLPDCCAEGGACRVKL